LVEKTMPLDHYIPQVHLQKFYSPVLGDRMYAIRKTDLKIFTPNSKAVCGINDGSTNAYVREDRAIEEFLKTIEPKYNAALDKLIHKKIDNECIYTIAGFIAYVITCSPAGMRIQSGPLKSVVETTATMLDAQGLFPPPPPVLAGPNLTELLRSGAVEVVIDPKFPQAIGISSILKLVVLLGNFTWEILHNAFDDSPFFTSDFPTAIEKTDDPRILNRIVPLVPNLALRIIPDHTLDRSRLDLTFANLRCHTRNISRQELVKLNRLIVRCAEVTVFYRDDSPWVQPFIAKNRHYRIQPYTQELKTPTGTLLVSTQRVVPSTPPVELTKASAG
jgi:hypothetical protein